MNKDIHYYIAKIKDCEKNCQKSHKEYEQTKEDMESYFRSYFSKVYPDIKVHNVMIEPEKNTFGITLSKEINYDLIIGTFGWEYSAQNYSSSVDQYWYLFNMEEKK